ncbi:Protein pbn-1 [Ceratocystis platani]|uniref:Protein PBN1 n=1 Tax=Ceratocystis fimbriata f. sp. platani TaxID=88771 RepID=A0A0F8CN46_CERFI|nr:Protein pbn-1 [Ceratocystis platani]
MRHRITFVHRPEESIEPDALALTETSISGPALSEAMREDRFTVGLSELPEDVGLALESFSELHLRWASTRPYESVAPFTVRVTPGFHLFSALEKNIDAVEQLPALCAFVSEAFGPLDCSDPEAFTKRLAEDNPSAPSDVYQFYQPVASLDAFSEFLKAKFCPLGQSVEICNEVAGHMKDLISLDLSYDKAAKIVRLIMTWPMKKHTINISSLPDSSEAPYRTEVGILTKGVPAHLNPGQVGMGGLVSVLGESKKPSAVLFSFPSRHQRAEATFSARFLPPTGLHPVWKLQMSSGAPPETSEQTSCTPHVYLTLPRSIFVDRYQLADQLFAQSKNISALRYSSSPVDLEKPEYATPTWGSAVLLDLVPPAAVNADGSTANAPWTVEIPLHLRYLEPSNTGYTDLAIPYPAVFWACGAVPASDSDKLGNNPFDRANVGYDSLFEQGTVFWHVTPEPATQRASASAAAAQLTSRVSVPVLNARASGWVELGTAAAVIAGFVWVVWCLSAGASMARKTVPKKKGDEKTKGDGAETKTKAKKSQ